MLEEYPSPFLQDGKFNGILVVGDEAPAEDVIALSDIAISLTYTTRDSENTLVLPDLLDSMSVGETKTYEFDLIAFEVTVNKISKDMTEFSVNGEIHALRDAQTSELADGSIIGVEGIYIPEDASEPKVVTFFLSRTPLTVEKTEVEVATAMLASEVNDVTKTNSILIGHACDNPLIMEVRGQTSDCNEGYSQGKATIEAYQFSNGKVSVVLTGDSPDDRRYASQVLIYYLENKELLRGTKVELNSKAEPENMPKDEVEQPEEINIIAQSPPEEPEEINAPSPAQENEPSSDNELFTKIGITVVILLVLVIFFLWKKKTGK